VIDKTDKEAEREGGALCEKPQHGHTCTAVIVYNFCWVDKLVCGDHCIT
jgi:hypothetical protein